MAREITTGWERGDPAEEGWSVVTGTIARINTTPNQDTGGNGGAYALRSATSGEVQSMQFPNGAHREGWLRAYLLLESGGVDDWFLTAYDGATAQFTVQLDGSDQFLRIRRGAQAGTIIATDNVAISFGVYHRVEIHYYIDNSAGFVRVYVDDNGTYTTPYLEFTGDTQNSSNDDCDRWNCELNGGVSRMDDFAVNSITLLYDGGTGTAPVVGQTITSAGGATAVIHQVHGDATSGRLVIHSASAAFADNEVLTSATLNAFVNAPNGNYVNGLEPQSAAPGEGFIVYLIPDANGNTSDLDGTDGNQTDNYLLVDDDPVDTTTEGVFTGTTGRFDTYGIPNLPATANSINHVQVDARAWKDGSTINVLNGMVRIGSTDYDSESQYDANLSASADHYFFPFTMNPATGAAWTVAVVNACEVGGRLTA